jgi:hypothetical protein
MAITKEVKEAIEAAKADLRNELKDIKAEFEEKIKQIELEKLRLTNDNADLKKRIEVLEKEKPNDVTGKPLFSSFIKKTSEGAPPVSESETRVFNAISSECKEKAKKEKNIIMFGVQESKETEKAKLDEHDLNGIGKIFDDINLDKTRIIKHFRLKSKDATKPGAVVVELDSVLYQKQVLSSASELRKFEEYKNKVYINPDLTFRERASLKLLLEERKKLNKAELDKSSTFRFVIRNDMLEKIEIKKK